MVAIDTNVLVYAEMATSKQHERAVLLLTDLAKGTLPWAIPWPCVYEFLRVITHPRLNHPPMPAEEALDNVRQLAESKAVVFLQETPRHLEIMDELIRRSGVTGNLVYDAHIAALCLEHGVSELLTGDRDFLRFPGLKVSNPFGN